MPNLFNYLVNQGVATQRTICPDLAQGVRGLPMLTEQPCKEGCSVCVEVCPTDAISIFKVDSTGGIKLDLGACIGCGLCVDACPTGTIVNNPSTRIARRTREELILTSGSKNEPVKTEKKFNLFKHSVAARVVSTGCSACDAEIGASGNPIFDIERFGVTVVASPRFADALIVTGPVSKGMQSALLSCYQAMSSPKVVVALGTCAISGGVHRGGYAEANGVSDLLPVSVYIPGCPPHPWSIIHGILLAMDRAPE